MLAGKKTLVYFANFFKGDFPCLKAWEVVLDLWKKYWLENKNCPSDNISSTLTHSI